MSTVKAYTDLEQSKMLAKILPIESADMYWLNRHIDLTESKYEVFVVDKSNKHIDFFKSYAVAVDNNEIIPCWSLAALLSVLPTIHDRNAEFCKDISYDKWHVYYHSTATLSIIDTNRYENVIDVCVEMIIKLHKSNLL